MLSSVAFVVWELINHAFERKMNQIREAKESEIGAGGDRFATLLQLARRFILGTLATMVALIALSAIGVEIGPLLAGAGIVGLAVGFGAQTLVKDIISGIFFLMDDAFRMGDYIEVGSVKGMVENISIRSLRLRHHRGMVQTIPFGDIGEVTNFTRDYIIMKLDFRVTYDTNPDKVRKLVKKIDKELQQHEEIGPALLSKIKCSGIKALEESAMIMRVKFKALPGEQFFIRRHVLMRIQKMFEKNGIHFAHRNVTVNIPEVGEAEEAEAKKAAVAAAASAAAAQMSKA